MAVAAIHEIIPGDPNATPDVAWREKINKQIKAESDRLETELKGYKNNLIKESIRVGDSNSVQGLEADKPSTDGLR